VSVFLDGETRSIKECEVLDQRSGLVEVDQNTNSTFLSRLKNSAQKPHQIEGWEFTLFGMKEDIFAEVVWEIEGRS